MSILDPIVVGVLGIILFLLLLIVGVPVGISMAMVGFAGFAYLVSWKSAVGKIALTPFVTMIDYNFAVVPAFILMAQILRVSGLGGKLYDLCEKWLGHRRGGLALATVLAAAVFASISASTIATVVTIGAIAMPGRFNRRYDRGFAGATVAAAGGLGVLIPPSAILILYALMTEQSIRALFIAGIVPGLLLVLVYGITILIWTWLKPDMAPGGEQYSIRVKLEAIANTWEILLLIILTIGGLTLGWFTPTEAGAIGASGAILIALVRKKLTWTGFMQALTATAASSGMVVLIMIGAFIFNYFVSVTKIPQTIVAFVGELNMAPIIIMIFVSLMYLILGMFMDSLAMMLLTVPFMFPVIQALGYSPVWFGVFIVMVMEMAVITPPVGMNVYATSGLVRDLPLETIFKRVFPFVSAQVVVIILILLWPEVVTFLPELLMRR